MSKREKIIIGVMVFSILFALVYFLTPTLTGQGEKTGGSIHGIREDHPGNRHGTQEGGCIAQ